MVYLVIDVILASSAYTAAVVAASSLPKSLASPSDTNTKTLFTPGRAEDAGHVVELNRRCHGKGVSSSGRRVARSEDAASALGQETVRRDCSLSNSPPLCAEGELA